MYTMKVVVSSVSRIMMFPFNEKADTLDQLNYYDPHATTNPSKFLPILEEVNPPPYVDIDMGVCKYFDLLGSYSGPPPKIPTLKAKLMYTILTYENESQTLLTSSSMHLTRHGIEQTVSP